MIFALIKAFILGIVVAAPPGPVLFFVMQKTMCESRRAGLFAGGGSALADTAYAAVGVYALGLVGDFINAHTPIIMLVGGLLVAFLGWNMSRKVIAPADIESGVRNGNGGFAYSLQTMLCAFSNPAALFVAMGLLAAFNLDASTLDFPAWMIIPFVFAGEFTYWTLLTFALRHFLHPGPKMLQTMSRLAGFIILAIGLYLAVKGTISLVK